MITFKCKMCGGDLSIIEGNTVCECEFCGTQQTIPTADNEKKTSLFNRANRLRMNAEFDKASAVYESIVAEFPEEAEAYWGLCLCAYGIEYVDDPATGEKKPTCHRTVPTSIMEDSNFEQACENADVIARRMYREEAKTIDLIQRDILAIVSSEEPYDVFICYKETAEEGGRTEDSVLAQDIYDNLTSKGLKVFFSRITLEDKLGQQYEPYIYAALSSAKVMLAIGTKFEYYDAVWVKNEWMRFLSMMKTQKDKTLIPCYKGLDAYDMPKEFKNLQAQDMAKLGWLQDLTRGVLKLCGKEVSDSKSTSNEQGQSVNNLLKRAEIFIQDGEKEKADEYINKALDLSPECSQAYYLKVLNRYDCTNELQLAEKKEKALSDKDYIRAKKLATGKEKEKFVSIEKAINSSQFRQIGNIVLFGCLTSKKSFVVSAWDNSSGDSKHVSKHGEADISKKIEWIVVETKDGKSLLVSKNAIGSEPFQVLNDEDYDEYGYEDYKDYEDSGPNNGEKSFKYVSWKDCSLRDWLNKRFCADSFDKNEKTAIITTVVDNSSDQGYAWNTSWKSTEPETQDHVFLLSYSEVEKYFPHPKDRIINGQYDKPSSWWLRSPGIDSNWKDTIDETGEVSQQGYGWQDSIRPAIWVDLNSPYFEKKHDNDWKDAIAKSEKQWEAEKKALEEKLLLEIKERKEANKDINKAREEAIKEKKENEQAKLDKALEIMKAAKNSEDYSQALDLLHSIEGRSSEYDEARFACNELLKKTKQAEQTIANRNIANTAISELKRKYDEDLKIYSENETLVNRADAERKTLLQSVEQLQQRLISTKNALSSLHGLFIKKKKEELESEIQRILQEINNRKAKLSELESRISDLKSHAPKKLDHNTLVFEIAKIYHDNKMNAEAIMQLKMLKDYKEADQLIESIREEKKQQYRTVGNVITFGHEKVYNDPMDEIGHDVAIEWIVLATHDNRSLLLSRFVLQSMPYKFFNKLSNLNMDFNLQRMWYHSQKTDITWETCDLRKWLNNDFINSSFNREEKDAILLIPVDNSQTQGYESYQTTGGINTFDKVFLLSYQEAFKRFFATEEDRKCYYYKDKEDICKWQTVEWWLRSPGKQQNQAMIVDWSGEMFYAWVSTEDDYAYIHSGKGVRPALWIDLNSDCFQDI